MNTDWGNFLKSQNTFSSEKIAEYDSITALTYLSVLKITGTDASSFLQGQLTCNINDLTESNSFFAAYCNAKGRTISTLLIIKTATDFLLVLPNELIDKVSQKLQMYIMRADVQLHNMSDDLCILGASTLPPASLATAPKESFSVDQNKDIYIKFPLHGNRYLIISTPSQAISLWTDLTENTHFIPNTANIWIEQDISAGIPWLTKDNSEKYIPQMLNIDKLGGISFNKGCYTGQEIIARTHYLGKSKRELFLASCESTQDIPVDAKIITGKSEQTVGKVLSLQSNGVQTKLLVVLQSTDSELNNLMLNNSNQDKIKIIDFQ